jgi:hypothetical protein
MKLTLALSLLCIALAGCAGTPPRNKFSDDENDVQKIVSVNQWALSRGATVVWLHYPQKQQRSDAGGG